MRVHEEHNSFRLRPFLRGLFANLHEADFSGRPFRARVEAALTPDNGLYEAAVHAILARGRQDVFVLAVLLITAPALKEAQGPANRDDREKPPFPTFDSINYHADLVATWLRLIKNPIQTMSIVTKTGDDGTTALMYGRRVPKTHARVEAYGCVDELNASLGLARATARHAFVGDNLLPIQKDLVALMAELALLPEDLPRYVKDGYPQFTGGLIGKLDDLAKRIEAQKIYFKGWATPGATANSAALDVARTVCRRAERRVCGLQEAGALANEHIIVYLNRLSDVLWLLARWVESQEELPPPPTVV